MRDERRTSERMRVLARIRPALTILAQEVTLLRQDGHLSSHFAVIPAGASAAATADLVWRQRGAYRRAELMQLLALRAHIRRHWTVQRLRTYTAYIFVSNNRKRTEHTLKLLASQAIEQRGAAFSPRELIFVAGSGVREWGRERVRSAVQ